MCVCVCIICDVVFACASFCEAVTVRACTSAFVHTNMSVGESIFCIIVLTYSVLTEHDASTNDHHAWMLHNHDCDYHDRNVKKSLT